jgi:hypothetical protein
MPICDPKKQPPAMLERGFYRDTVRFTMPDGTTGHATFESKPVGAAAIVAAEVIHRYNANRPGAITMIELPPEPSTPRRWWIAATVIACITGFALGYAAPVKADPTYCGPYRCSPYDREHDRRAEQRRYERELDRRDSLREEQRQWERIQDNVTRDMENMLRRNEYEDQRRYR